MARLTITEQDIKRSTVLDAGWYPVQVTGVTEETNKAGDAQNIIVDFVGIGSNDADKNKAKGVPLRRYFSEKAPGFAVNYIKACGGAVPEAGGTFELANTTGKRLEVFVKSRLYEGNQQNDVKEFRPLETA